MDCPPEVLNLVERFERELDSYRSGKYNETQVRREFIDPMLKALGWDIDNEQGYAEAYKDVVHEDAIKIGTATKAPDYCLRVGGTRKFFLEAKKPSINVKMDVAPAFQLRRYAWSAKLPLSVLTDFEEFAVYDCRVKPQKQDKASVARILYLNSREYPTRWEEIAGIFSRDAILKGSFDRFADSSRRKRGTAEVDTAFLAEIESWRDSLARHMALRNPTLAQRELNFAVQQTIDRIIFLRICEDRGIEDYGQLREAAKGAGIYSRLLQLFVRADHRYNSGLFHFQKERARGESPDLLTPSLAIEDRPLRQIITSLYYPDSPYEFSVLPADILGQVYEQFLGKVIRLTAGHRAVVEDKPEVKKAGGVYYTPTYIVEYIVKHTVGKLLEGSTPKKASSSYILDPACGSGSFLIGAFQYLIDWHRDWYVEDGPQKHTKEIFLGPGGEWRLTTVEKKRILLNNIYGVDIDSQAVETTKLSLLLKVLEGETQETINAQLSFLHERALPDLASNIKCGNSLIGPDFYNDQQLRMLPDAEERYRINVFDWETEFPQILGKTAPASKRGFDAVIGNPPWLMPGYWDKTPLDYLRVRYTSSTGKYDMYYLFIERGLGLLCASGKLGLIVPNKFFHTGAARALRGLLGNEEGLHEIVDFGDSKLFSSATNYSCVILVDRGQAALPLRVRRADVGVRVIDEFDIDRRDLCQDPWYFAPPLERSLALRMEESGEHLEGLVQRFATGVQSGADRLLVVSSDQALHLGLEPQLLTPILRGRDVRRYSLSDSPSLLMFPYKVVQDQFVLLTEAELTEYPHVRDYLMLHREALARRVWFGKGARELSGAWYGMMYLEPRTSLVHAHILTPCLSNVSNFALGSGQLFATGTAGVAGLVLSDGAGESPNYLLALLNSKLLSWYITTHSPVFSGGYHKFSAPYLRPVPIRRIDWSSTQDTKRHEAMGDMVESVQTLQTHLAAARTTRDRDGVERELGAVLHRLDSIVYELYGLTDNEIAVVESSSQ
ncbi:MAG: N-6 DNA methylase [Actinobacteria bacterium]|nr:N-6 DNA methylase [Actinomycetota bacterium]